MKPETGTKVTYGVWGLILGAAIAIIIGFAWGGWLTRGGAQEATDAALSTTRAAICVAQFTKAPDYEARLKKLEEMNSWDRAKFIRENGWDKMPGEEESSSYTVSVACANGLEILMEK